MTNTSNDWLDAQKASSDALSIAKNAAAAERANRHLLMLLLATIAKTAPKEAVDQLHAELERIRDLSGPAGAVANEIFATAVATLERYERRD
jgi:hypothetical protein